MPSQIERQLSAEWLSVPWSLADWVDREALLTWVREEIAGLDWSNPEVEKFLRENPNYHPRLLLTLLAYAYVTGLFESEEISRLTHSDAVLREICGDYRPTTRTLDRFRRDNRGILKWCVVQALKRGVRAKYKLSLLPPGLRRHLEQSATERLDLARHMDRAGQRA